MTDEEQHTRFCTCVAWHFIILRRATVIGKWPSVLKHPSLPPLVPVFPNGAPGSFQISVLIQRVAAGISDEMSEGFARICRGLLAVLLTTT
jgi:hypothetical protein